MLAHAERTRKQKVDKSTLAGLVLKTEEKN